MAGSRLKRLRNALSRRFPDLSLEIDEPAADPSACYLVVGRSGNLPAVVVDWRRDRGWGVSTPLAGDLRSGPDEVYLNQRAACDRVVRLVLSGGRTRPRAVPLAELRQALGISQEELAERAGVGQANIARIESRADLKIGTLAWLVEAMGAALSIRARLPDGSERELDWSRAGAVPAHEEELEAEPRPSRRTSATLDELAKLMHVASDSTRMRILDTLCGGKRNVTELCQALGDTNQPAASHHLGILRTSGLVEYRRAGKRIYYSLTPLGRRLMEGLAHVIG